MMGVDSLLWPGWLRWSGRRQAGEKPEAQITDGWPKRQGLRRKYLPRRLFLREILRVVKCVLLLGKLELFSSLGWKEQPRRKNNQEEKQYS